MANTDLVNKGFLDTTIANNPGPAGPKGDTGATGPAGSDADATAYVDAKLGDLGGATVKDYTDAAVAASGGGVGMPTHLSNLRGGVSFRNAAIYCANLVEAGFDDWRLPSADEVAYANYSLTSEDGSDARTYSSYLWTSSDSGNSGNWTVFYPSIGTVNKGSYDSTEDVRCVR